MAAVSEFVVDEADVEAVQDEGDTASARLTFQVEHLEQRVIRYAPGRSDARRSWMRPGHPQHSSFDAVGTAFG